MHLPSLVRDQAVEEAGDTRMHPVRGARSMIGLDRSHENVRPIPTDHGARIF